MYRKNTYTVRKQNKEKTIIETNVKEANDQVNVYGLKAWLSWEV